jgi:hypothetical protein
MRKPETLETPASISDETLRGAWMVARLAYCVQFAAIS